jgi:hypothetical protein
LHHRSPRGWRLASRFGGLKSSQNWLQYFGNGGYAERSVQFQRIKNMSEHMANAPEEVLVIRAKSLANKLGKTWDERLEGILRFCIRDPAQWFPSRGKKKIVSWMDIDDRYLEQYVGRYYREREGFVVLQPVATKKDPAVDEVLKAFENVPPEDLERIGKAHRVSMQAENIIGELLERYVARMLENKGWIWCCGETMKSVDFIKGADKGEAKLLQIKNRSNSENSSSSAIRRGTTIEKWYRTSSTTGKTRWDLLPENSDADGSERRTEEGFYQFVIEEAKRRPSIEEIPMETDDREPQLTATR